MALGFLRRRPVRGPSLGPEKRDQRPIQHRKLLAATAEMGVHRGADVVGTAEVDHGQGLQEGQHPSRSRIKAQSAKDATEMQPVAGQDDAGVRH